MRDALFPGGVRALERRRRRIRADHRAPTAPRSSSWIGGRRPPATVTSVSSWRGWRTIRTTPSARASRRPTDGPIERILGARPVLLGREAGGRGRARRSDRAPSSTPARRSSGSACADRSVARSSAPSSTRAGRTRSRPRARWRAAATSPSRPVTITAPSGRWRESSRRRCPSSWSRTLPRRQPRLRDPQRGARQGPALRRLRCGSARTASAGWPDTLAPALGDALRARGPIDLKNITAQALPMGDECHNRNVAATGLFTRIIAPALCRTSSSEVAADVLEFLEGNNHFYLNLSMAACKAALDSAHGIADSTVVTTMARNGVEFGMRMSGTGDRWFTAPAAVPDGLYFPGYGPRGRQPGPRRQRDHGDDGDRRIRHGGGAGHRALRRAGRRPTRSATRGRCTRSRWRGTETTGSRRSASPVRPRAIDARRVVDGAVAPVINTGIAHREAGIGQIGAGIVRAPLACFTAAIEALGRQLELARMMGPRAQSSGGQSDAPRTVELAVNGTLMRGFGPEREHGERRRHVRPRDDDGALLSTVVHRRSPSCHDQGHFGGPSRRGGGLGGATRRPRTDPVGRAAGPVLSAR